MEDHITEAEIWAYSSENADSITYKKVEAWIKSEDYDQKLYAKVTKIYFMTGENPYHDVADAKKKFFKSVALREKKTYAWNNLLKYAAVLAFVIATGMYAYRQLPTTNRQELVQTTYGEHREVHLSDGSTVWLHPSSKLFHDIGSPRTLYLEGEAFFEVAKDKDRPFTVTTPDYITVTALGTSFNVKSYAENTFTETVLLTGKVAVTSNEHFKEKIIMAPNDKVTFYRSNKNIVKSKAGLTEDGTAWKKGKIQFANKAFKDIAIDLLIQYNIKIRFENEQISNSKFTGSFDAGTPAIEILETLQLSKYFTFRQHANDEWAVK